jgi:hypothetical protein
MSALFAAASPRRSLANAWIGRLAIGVALASSWTALASATPVTYTNDTLAVPYSNGSPTGSAPTTPIGSEFSTPQVTINQSGNSLDMQFTTTFPGPSGVTVGSATAYAADIFFATGAQASANPIAPTAYNFAIALGDQSANGGLSAGFYSVNSVKTSQDVWSSRAGFTYGGQYVLASNTADAQLAPTVLTSGSLLSGWTVTQSWSGGVLDVTLTALDAATFALLLGNDDLFWGTADCDNGPIFEQINVASNNVPEPGTLALFGTGLLGFAFLRRRNNGNAIFAAAA